MSWPVQAPGEAAVTPFPQQPRHLWTQRALQPMPDGDPPGETGAADPPLPSVAPGAPPPTVRRRRRPALVDPSDLVGRVPRGEFLHQRILRAIGQGLGTTRGPRELERLAAAAQRPVTTGRRIAVTSARGGAGKSAVTALLGMVFAARRADPVLVADADPAAGSLAWRLGLPVPMTTTELASSLLAAHVEDLQAVADVLPRTPGGLWLLPGGSGGQAELTRDITVTLSRLFAICVVDCGLGMDSVADSHAVVLVTPATPDGVRSTVAALEEAVQVNPGLLARAVVALNTLHPAGRAALRRGSVAAALGPYRVPVVTLPFDRHVGSGAPIHPGRIAQPTLLAVTRLAALSLRKAAQS